MRRFELRIHSGSDQGEVRSRARSMDGGSYGAGVGCRAGRAEERGLGLCLGYVTGGDRPRGEIMGLAAEIMGLATEITTGLSIRTSVKEKTWSPASVCTFRASVSAGGREDI